MTMYDMKMKDQRTSTKGTNRSWEELVSRVYSSYLNFNYQRLTHIVYISHKTESMPANGDMAHDRLSKNRQDTQTSS